MATYPIRTRHWTRKEYEHFVELGVLHEDEPIELIGGQMVVAEPKNSPLATAVGLTADALRSAFGSGWVVREQDPVALDDREPVIAPAARFGWKYDRVRILKLEATVSPLVLPGATIAVADLLP
jgi:hypothetical protein